MSKLTSLLFLSLAAVGCGSSSDVVLSVPNEIRGRALGTDFVGATVRAYPVREDGGLGYPAATVLSYPLPEPQPLASAPLDTSGRFVLPWNGEPILLEIASGTYGFEGSAQTLSSATPLRAAATSGNVLVSPLSTASSTLALALTRGGLPAGQAFAQADAKVASRLGLPGVLGEANPSARASSENDHYQLQAGFVRLAQRLRTTPAELARATGRDLVDGLLDGDGQFFAESGPADLPANILTTELSRHVDTTAVTPSVAASLASSDATVSAPPGRYASPYQFPFTLDLSTLTQDFAIAPRADVAAESTQPPFAQWYQVGAYPKSQLAWGPEPTRYPVPAVGTGDPVVWKRERLLATAQKYVGRHYQHHHIPDWDPSEHNWPEWLHVSLGQNSAGIDCSDFTGWCYNYGLGIHLNTAVAVQAAQTEVETSDGLTLPVERLLQVSSSAQPVDFAQLRRTLQPGDLLYIRGKHDSDPGTNITHVIMWVGGDGPDPLVVDSHDNSPKVYDSNNVLIPSGVQLRPLREGSWYHLAFDHAHRIVR